MSGEPTGEGFCCYRPYMLVIGRRSIWLPETVQLTQRSANYKAQLDPYLRGHLIGQSPTKVCNEARITVVLRDSRRPLTFQDMISSPRRKVALSA